MRRNAFPFPLPAMALDEFRHPAEWHLFHRACRHGGEVLAGNGYLALRAMKGNWLDDEFPAASAEFLSRFGKLPWDRFKGLPDAWEALDRQRGRIFERARHGQWLDGKAAPSPVWEINGKVRVRLSHLQVVAMLPRAEVYVGHADKTDPLFVKFSGGLAMIAADARLERHTGVLFAPRTCCLTKETLRREDRPRPRLVQPGVVWPPVDTTEG
jgi:hypothetical protein